MRPARGLLLAALLLPGAVPARAADRGPATAGEAALEYLAAFQGGDAETCLALSRTVEPDPVRIAGGLFALHVEGALKDPPEPGDALAAAADLARRAAALPGREGLPRLVEAWKGLSREDLLLERRLARSARAAFEAFHLRNDTPAVLREAEASREDRAKAKWSLSAVDLAVREGRALRDSGRLREAVEACREAIARTRGMEWPRGRTGFLGALTECAAALRDLGEFHPSLAAYEDELAVHRAWGNRLGEFGTLGNMGVLHARMGNLALSQELFETARRGFEEAGNEVGALLFRMNGLENLADTGRPEEAVAGLEAALAEFDARGQPHWAAGAMEALGRVHLMECRYARALVCLEECLRRRRVVGERARTAETLRILGEAWERAGDPERALEVQEELLREVEAMKSPLFAASARLGMGRVLSLLGRHDRAREQFAAALTGFESLGARKEVASARIGDAEACLGLGRVEEALALFEKGAEAARATGDRVEGIRADAGCALALERLGRLDPARERYGRAAGDAEDAGDLATAASALTGRARIDLLRGRTAEAMEGARAAMERRLRSGLALAEETGRRNRREARAAADIGIEACLALSRGTVGDAAARPAVEFMEGGRAAVLAESLENRDSLLRAAAGPEIARQDLAARRRAGAVRSELGALAARRAPAAEIAAARAELDAAYRTLRDMAAKVRRTVGAASEASDPRVADVAEIQEALGGGAALLLFHMARPRAGVPGRASLAVVDATGVRLLDLGPAEPIRRAAEAYSVHVSTPGTSEADQAAALYELLLRPAAGLLRGRARIVVCPDGPLTLLPFEALLDRGPGGPLRAIETWEVSYAPSGTVLAALAREDGGRPRGSGLLALADPAYPGIPAPGTARPLREAAVPGGIVGLPRLEGTAEEVRAVEPFYPEEGRTVLLGERASAEGFAGALRSRRGRLAVVHLACHGVLDRRRPFLSGLALARGEVLTVHDLHGLRIPADLAVLSACETGRGPLEEGEGLIGLVRGFLIAGCPRVVAAGWKVDDRDVAAFMADFHRSLRQDGLSPAAALRAAKVRRLRAGGEAAHPSRWAAFVLWGLPE